MRRERLNVMLRSSLLAFALLLATGAAASADDYVLDPVHTQAEFTVVHLAISQVSGHIPLTSGTLTLGANDLPTAATATFDVTALDSGDAHRDGSLKSDSFFDVAQYPTMTFVERKIEGTAQSFTMTGDLTLHGVTKPIVLTGKLIGAAVLRGKRAVGYTATTTFDRRDFGITFGNVMGGNLIAGYDVSVTINVAANAK